MIIDYVVDLTKPPIGPPGTEIKTGFFKDKETKDSILNKKNYQTYIKEYRYQLDRKELLELLVSMTGKMMR